MYPEGADDITLRLDRRSSLTLPSSSLLVLTSFVCGGPLVWDRAVGKTREVLEGSQSFRAAGPAEAEGDEVELFTSSCQSRFKVLSDVREGTDLFSCAAVSEEVGCESPVIEVFSSSEEGSKSRINHIEHGLDPTR